MYENCSAYCSAMVVSDTEDIVVTVNKFCLTKFCREHNKQNSVTVQQHAMFYHFMSTILYTVTDLLDKFC
jgi:hypothetical protein